MIFKTALLITLYLSFSLTAIADYSKDIQTKDFTPQLPYFPHGKGISSRGKFAYGLDFPSFNNFTDMLINSKFVIGTTDERRFLVIQNLGPSGKNKNMPYGNTVSAKIGDLIYVRAYIHNNGVSNTSKTTAKNVLIGFSSPKFLKDKNFYFSTAGREIVLTQFIYSKNAKPRRITDSATVISSTGQPIKLLYVVQKNSIQTRSGKLGKKYYVNPVDFISGGANIGDVKAERIDSFYTWVALRVVHADD